VRFIGPLLVGIDAALGLPPHGAYPSSLNAIAMI
jgi:hypothetical protein